MAEISQEELKRFLHYDPETGVFTNLIRRSNLAIGEKAGCINKLGYVKLALIGKQYLGHRLAWLYVHGYMPVQIDHVNCIRSDNRISNLRPCTQALNVQNLRSSHCDSQTGTLGVSLIRETGRFRARITINGKCKQIGCFSTRQEAYAAYVQHKAITHEFSTI